MGQEFLKNLKEFVEKYPFPKIHKILFCFISIINRAKNSQDFLKDSLPVVLGTQRGVMKIMKKMGDKIPDEFEGEMAKITQDALIFSQLTEEEAKEITEYFKTLLAPTNDSLEMFLSAHFSSKTKYLDFLSSLPATNSLALAIGLEKDLGHYKEHFTLFPAKKISNEDIVRAIVEFYKNKGLTIERTYEDSVFMREGDTSLNVFFSNCSETLHVTVNEGL